MVNSSVVSDQKYGFVWIWLQIISSSDMLYICYFSQTIIAISSCVGITRLEPGNLFGK